MQPNISYDWGNVHEKIMTKQLYLWLNSLPMYLSLITLSGSRRLQILKEIFFCAVIDQREYYSCTPFWLVAVSCRILHKFIAIYITYSCSRNELTQPTPYQTRIQKKSQWKMSGKSIWTDTGDLCLAYKLLVKSTLHHVPA